MTPEQEIRAAALREAGIYWANIATMCAAGYELKPNFSLKIVKEAADSFAAYIKGTEDD